MNLFTEADYDLFPVQIFSKLYDAGASVSDELKAKEKSQKFISNYKWYKLIGMWVSEAGGTMEDAKFMKQYIKNHGGDFIDVNLITHEFQETENKKIKK